LLDVVPFFRYTIQLSCALGSVVQPNEYYANRIFGGAKRVSGHNLIAERRDHA